MIPSRGADDSLTPGKNREFGAYPTPLERVSSTSLTASGLLHSSCEFWVKRDDRTSPVYGGNKVRKLAPMIDEARARGAKRLVTIGAAGSHHVLATAIFGRAAGLAVDAVLVGQPESGRARENLRAGLAHGLNAIAAGPYALAPFALAPLLARRDAYFVQLGGSSVAGSMGYVDAARELAEQVRAGVMPEPDEIVVALGSGGTAAGLAAGLAREGMRTRVVGVCISDPAWLLGIGARWLARACAKRAGVRAEEAAARLAIEPRYIGRGYGYATDEGMRAIAIGAAIGIELEAVYTAKAFAAALDRAASGEVKTLLYWHTLSSAPMEPLLLHGAAPDLTPRLRRLFA